MPTDAPAPTLKDRRYADLSLLNDRPGEWGHVFSPLGGDAWWIALGDRPHSPALDRWGARNLWHGWMGWRVDPAHWQDDESKSSPNPPDRGFDVIVWFRKIGPSHAWPEPAS